jgi:hypothetical protein
MLFVGLFCVALGGLLGARHRAFALAPAIALIVGLTVIYGVAASWPASGLAVATITNVAVLQLAYCSGVAVRSWSSRTWLPTVVR